MINERPRAYRSINWPEYFVYSALSQSVLSPSSKVYFNTYYNKQPAPGKHVSINYAWAGAMTINGFTNLNYAPENEQTENQAYNAVDLYRARKKLITALGIPGTLKQVSFYTQDIANNRVNAYPNSTAYLMYVGGNDISNAMKNDLLKLKLTTFFDTIGSIKNPGTMAENVRKSVDQLMQPITSGGAGAKHIYVFTYPNIANTPEAYHFASNGLVRWILHEVITSCVSTYNAQLEEIFSASKYKGIVTILPIGGAINSLSKLPRFTASVQKGLSCIDEVATATNATPSINNCNYNNNQTYFGWNNAHFTTAVNQKIAYAVYSDMLNPTPSIKLNQQQGKNVSLKKWVNRFEQVMHH